MEIKTQLIYIQWFIKPNAHLTYYEVVGLKEDMGGGEDESPQGVIGSHARLFYQMIR